mgnify:CR=1 FL=1
MSDPTPRMRATDFSRRRDRSAIRLRLTLQQYHPLRQHYRVVTECKALFTVNNRRLLHRVWRAITAAIKTSV